MVLIHPPRVRDNCRDEGPPVTGIGPDFVSDKAEMDFLIPAYLIDEKRIIYSQFYGREATSFGSCLAQRYICTLAFRLNDAVV